jgi:hypothetical protein
MTRKDFYKTINERNLNGCGIEIGVCLGNFSLNWIPLCHFEKNYLVDPWKHYKSGYDVPSNCEQKEQDERYLKVKETYSSYGNRGELLRMESLEAVKLFPDNYFDFIYIDANHEYEHVKADINAWYPKIKKNGIFAGHDYNNKHKGVIRAVSEFRMSHNLQLQLTQESCASWYFFVN